MNTQLKNIFAKNATIANISGTLVSRTERSTAVRVSVIPIGINVNALILKYFTPFAIISGSDEKIFIILSGYTKARILKIEEMQRHTLSIIVTIFLRAFISLLPQCLAVITAAPYPIPIHII